MSGYQEILSDPSYAGQFVTMTYPEIGNYGVNGEDMESHRFFVNGFIMHHLNEPSNWRADSSLKEALEKWGIPAIEGIDTRALTTKLRIEGTKKAFMSVSGKVSEEAAIQKAREWCGLNGQDYAKKVSCKSKYRWDVDGKISNSFGMMHDGKQLPPADIKVVAYDFGIKWNILRNMRLNGFDVTVVPAQTTAEEVLKLKPDGVFLSNGPADPAAVTYAIEAVKSLIGKVPITAICLGHQIMGLALGGKTFKLKFGHHGCNHPVKNLETGAIEITSQNHNFAVAEESLKDEPVAITHINLIDHTVEGLRHKKEPLFSVQFHPEAGPGPHDAGYIFKWFRDVITKS
jgi:carbamoyl-phosphate synthase small subunit